MVNGVREPVAKHQNQKFFTNKWQNKCSPFKKIN